MAVPRDPSVFELSLVCGTEEAALSFCREQGLIPVPRLPSPNPRIGEFWGVCHELRYNPGAPECEGNVTTVIRKYKNGPKPYYKCNVCGKRTSQQHGLLPVGGAHHGTWFATMDRAGRPNCKIGKKAVLWIVYCMAKDISVSQTITLAKGTINMDKSAIIDWRNYTRELCQSDLATAPRMGGPGHVVQIDESLFRGRRKYNRGRLLQADGVPGRMPNNHGQRVEGPWVFGLLHAGTGELRLFHVDRRDAATLLPLIVENVAPGTTIWSDEWAAYAGIPACQDTPQNGGGPMGYIHQSVNHSVNFVDPMTGANTQKLEREWERCKLKLMRLSKGTSPALLPGHLAAMWWTSIHGHQKCPDPFMRLIALIRRHYPQV